MRRSTFIKAVCVLLLVAMVAPALAGCKKASPVDASVKQHVYKAEYFELPSEANNLGYLTVSGEKIFGVVYNYTDGYKQQIASMNIDGTDYKVLPGFELKESYTEDKNTYSYVNSLGVDDRGNLLLVTNSSTSYLDETSGNWMSDELYEIVTLSPDTGDVISRTDLSFLKESVVAAGGYFYVRTVKLVGDKTIVCLDRAIVTLDASGKKLFEITFDGYIQDIIVSNGRALVALYDYSLETSQFAIRELDFASKSLIDSGIELPGQSYNYQIISGNGYDLYMNSGTSLFGYDVATKEMTELLNWIDSDINGNNINSILPINAQEIICIGYNSTTGGQELARLTKVDPSEVPDKIVLTLAVNYLYYEMRNSVIEFNKLSEKYRIKIIEYSQYNTDDDYMAGSTKLNQDIISGNVPDIIYIESTMPVDSYISKGLFADIYALMNKDSSFNRADYLENVFEAYSRNGKLYSIVPSFNIYTVMSKSSNFAGKSGWTVDDVLAMLASSPAGTVAFSNAIRSEILQMCTYMGIDSYVNKDTGACSFNDGSFAKLLEFANLFPSEHNYGDMYGIKGDVVAVSSSVSVARPMPTSAPGIDINTEYMTEEDKVRAGYSLAQIVYMYEYITYKEKKYGYGEDPVYVGYPSPNGNGSAIVANSEYALYSKSKNLDGGWEFIKYLLSEESQSAVSWNFPVKLSRLEEIAADSMKPYSYTSYDGTVYEYPRYYWNGSESVEMENMTQQEVDFVTDFIKSVNTVLRWDNAMLEIISEEADAYFNGQRTAQEAANLIQSRVQIYISESR